MRRSGGRLGLQAIRFNNRAGVAALKLRPDMPVQQGVDDLCGCPSNRIWQTVRMIGVATPSSLTVLVKRLGFGPESLLGTSN